MPRIRTGASLAAAWIVLTASALFAQAPVASETLLPDSTKGFLSAPNLRHLGEQWQKTQLGQLMKDPMMKEFSDYLRDQLEGRLTQGNVKLGVTWDDIKDVPTGEVALARIQAVGGKAALAIVMNIAGHRKEADALVDKLTANLVQQGAKVVAPQQGQPPVTRIELPVQPGQDQESVYYFVDDRLLLAADDAGTIAVMMAHAAGKGNPKQTLAAVKAFDAIMVRCQKEAGQEAPQARWFIEPFGYAELVQSLNPERMAVQRKGRSLREVLKDQGFSAIQGLGGYVDFAVEGYEILHRTAIYAPPPHEKSMKMLVLPNGKDFAPQFWVPKDVANYTTIYADILNAFDNFGPFFDDLFGDGEKGVWQEVLDGMEHDPSGPQINLRRDLMAHLGQRATMISDYELPITPTSERLLYAVETRDEKAVAAAIRKLFVKDKTMRKKTLDGYDVWEAIPGAGVPAAKPKVELGGVPPLGPPPKPAAPSQPRVLPTAAVTVAHGQLFVASHFEFLKKVFDEAKKEKRDPLNQRLDYKLVDTTIATFKVPENCARLFSRTDEEYRGTYELIKQGRMPESETLLGRLLNRVFDTGKKGVARKQQIDGSKLPEYQIVARYLGPAGLFATSEKDGWFLVGFTLKK